MKTVILFFLIIGFGWTALASTNRPVLTPTLPSEMYVPPGFDDNDRSEIVIAGHFSNLCWRVGSETVTVDKRNFRIFVSNDNYVYENTPCARMVVPYIKTINVGVLPQGDYGIYFMEENNDAVRFGSMTIGESLSGSPDDNTYAPVEEAVFQSATENRPAQITLRGTFTNTCMHMGEVKVLHGRSPVVVEILPLMDLAEGACSPKTRPFEVVMPLENISEGRKLIHVRSLNGKSINRLGQF